MLQYEEARINRAIETVHSNAHQVLVENCYDYIDLRELEKALKLLLAEVDKK